MGADVAVGTVCIGVGHQEGFAEVEVFGFELGILFQRFALEECQRRICPAGTRVVLVFDACDGVSHNGGEHEGVFGKTFLFGSCLHCTSQS